MILDILGILAIIFLVALIILILAVLYFLLKFKSAVDAITTIKKALLRLFHK